MFRPTENQVKLNLCFTARKIFFANSKIRQKISIKGISGAFYIYQMFIK